MKLRSRKGTQGGIPCRLTRIVRAKGHNVLNKFALCLARDTLKKNHCHW